MTKTAVLETRETNYKKTHYAWSTILFSMYLTR